MNQAIQVIADIVGADVEIVVS
jgi:elongation factor 1-beta